MPNVTQVTQALVADVQAAAPEILAARFPVTILSDIVDRHLIDDPAPHSSLREHLSEAAYAAWQEIIT
jgi:hypothetical protein